MSATASTRQPARIPPAAAYLNFVRSKNLAHAPAPVPAVVISPPSESTRRPPTTEAYRNFIRSKKATSTTNSLAVDVSAPSGCSTPCLSPASPSSFSPASSAPCTPETLPVNDAHLLKVPELVDALEKVDVVTQCATSLLDRDADLRKCLEKLPSSSYRQILHDETLTDSEKSRRLYRFALESNGIKVETRLAEKIVDGKTEVVEVPYIALPIFWEEKNRGLLNRTRLVGEFVRTTERSVYSHIVDDDNLSTPVKLERLSQLMTRREAFSRDPKLQAFLETIPPMAYEPILYHRTMPLEKRIIELYKLAFLRIRN